MAPFEIGQAPFDVGNFWTSLAAGCLLTMMLYAGMVWLGPRFGLRL